MGLISYAADESDPGYNLVFPHGQGTTWLLDACGEAVNKWDDHLNRVPGNSVYLQENGDLLVCYFRRGTNTDPIWAGGAGGEVELRTWDNEIIWNFALNDSLHRLHHDVTMMPNGHVLMIAWELKTPEESIQNGRDPVLITEDALWPDYILEYNPDTDSIVWRWHAWDHLIQSYDSTKMNFGVIGEHPELIDVNHIYASGQADWMHSNAIDYHPEMDLIMLSVPHFDEIWFIDHSTTHEESKGHSGGYWGKGGDLVYRWGNPQVYDRGNSSDQKIFFSHDCHWVDDFLNEGDPYFGSVAIFNNRAGINFSTANIFTPVVDTINRTFGMIGNVFGPADFDETIVHPVDPELMFSSGLSSFQVLPNQNYLILAGRTGYAFELTPDQEIVWEYIVPIRNGSIISQGEVALNNTTFRMKRYPTWYSAFDGKDLSSKGYMELNPDTTYCDQLISSTLYVNKLEDFKLYPNPAHTFINVEFAEASDLPYVIYNGLGSKIKSGRFQDASNTLRVEDLLSGLYLLSVDTYQTKKFIITQ